MVSISLSGFAAILTVLLSTFTTAAQTQDYERGSKAAEISSIFHFPGNTTWLENIAVRSNGNLLLTTITSPTIYTLDPSSKAKEAELVYLFPNATTLLGITETSPDSFAVIVCSYNFSSFSPISGSFSIWNVDFTSKNNKPKARKIADIPDAEFLNGLTLLTPGSPYILAGDSALGAVFRVNIKTGAYKQVLADASFDIVPNSRNLPVGINGIHTLGDQLYFTNSAQNSFGRVPIYLSGSKSGEKKGAVKILSKGFGFADDFAIRGDEKAYVAAVYDDLVWKIGKKGVVEEIKGTKKLSLAGVTATAFGRGKRDQDVLYLVTQKGKVLSLGI